MLKPMGRALKFFFDNKIIVFLIFLVSILNSPLKSNGLTMMGSVFLSVFFVGGFVGLIHRIEKGKMEERPGVKSFIVEAGSSFSFIILNLFEVLKIAVVNIIFVTFFSVLPMIILQTKLSEKYSQTILTMIFLMIAVYRLPIIIYSYFTVIVNKSYGKEGIGKLKEIVWESPVIWFSVFIQAIIYITMTVLWFQYQSNLFLVTIIDVLRAMVFMYFMTVNYYIYISKLEKNEKYQEVFKSKIYDGRYKGFSGRFIM